MDKKLLNFVFRPMQKDHLICRVFFHLLWRDAIGVCKNPQMQASISTSGLANLKIKTRLITIIGTNKHEWSY